jgi:predicted Zn-dependent peptidase
MTRPETPEPVIVLIVDEVGALAEADVPTGLRAHLEQVLIAGRQAGVIRLPGGTATPAPTWLDAGELAALTSALVAAQVRQTTPPA